MDKKDFPPDKVYGSTERPAGLRPRPLTRGGRPAGGHRADNVIIIHADLVK
ncbi:hypothetical protein [Streptomyces sp. URMC 123]|uniref:hypothetical protein n=1 Tax=Streptomyces sp. URMC 123 TaxID=3423403 RepID=UPI003F1A6063